MTTSKEMIDLGEAVIQTDEAVAIVAGRHLVLSSSDRPGNTASFFSDYGPLVGVVCPPGTTAVAYPLDVSVRARSASQSTLIAVVVPRMGRSLIIDRLANRQLHPTTDVAPLIDVGRRAMRLATPPPGSHPIDLLDRIWLDRVMTTVLHAGLGADIKWPVVAALHPVCGSRPQPSHPTPTARTQFRVRWCELRAMVAGSSLRWPSMTPEIAQWLDTGSFSRWCIADTPEPTPILTDLEELLDPSVHRQIEACLHPDAGLEKGASDSGNGGQL